MLGNYDALIFTCVVIKLGDMKMGRVKYCIKNGELWCSFWKNGLYSQFVEYAMHFIFEDLPFCLFLTGMVASTGANFLTETSAASNSHSSISEIGVTSSLSARYASSAFRVKKSNSMLLSSSSHLVDASSECRKFLSLFWIKKSGWCLFGDGNWW